MYSGEEDFDRNGFSLAMKNLVSRDKILLIQKAANESHKVEISVGRSKLGAFQHKIYFKIHTQDEGSFASLTKLALKIQSVLTYGEVVIHTETSTSKASFRSHYSPFIKVSLDNIDELYRFTSEWSSSLKNEEEKSPEKIYDDFVEYLRESDEDTREALLRRLGEDCQDMGTDRRKGRDSGWDQDMDKGLNVERKRPRSIDDSSAKSWSPSGLFVKDPQALNLEERRVKTQHNKQLGMSTLKGEEQKGGGDKDPYQSKFSGKGY